jgi:hypothetical protein
MRCYPYFLLVVCLFLASSADQARAGLFVPGSSFTVDVTNDPLGNNFSGTVPLTGGPTTIDHGLLTVSETITPVNASTAWIEFDFNATGNVLVGKPSNNWEIKVSNIQTTAPTTLTSFFGFFDVNGVSTPFPFGGTTITTNPLTGVGNVYLGVVHPPYTYSTSQSLFANIDPFNQGPTNFGTNSSNTPSGFSIAGEYVLQPGVASVPEPSSLALCTVGLLSLAGGSWWRRKRVA